MKKNKINVLSTKDSSHFPFKELQIILRTKFEFTQNHKSFSLWKFKRAGAYCLSFLVSLWVLKLHLLHKEKNSEPQNKKKDQDKENISSPMVQKL